MIEQPKRYSIDVKAGLLVAVGGSAVVQTTTSNQRARRPPATPRLLVLHYTAAGGGADAVAAYMATAPAQVSAHLIVGRDGKVVQQVPFHRCAYHAGKALWNGSAAVNDLSIGIEICNWGWLRETKDGFRSWTGDVVDHAWVERGRHCNPADTHEWWECYTDDALTVVFGAAQAICGAYKIEAVAGHETVSWGRKTDPGPAFPLDDLAKFLGVPRVPNP